MKKNISLTLLAIPLAIGIGLGLNLKKNNYIPVRAEGEEIVEVVENDEKSVVDEVKPYFESVILPTVIASASTLIITALGLFGKWALTKNKDKHITENLDKSVIKAIEIKDLTCKFVEESELKIKEMQQEINALVDENKFLKDFFKKYEDQFSAITKLDEKVNTLIEIETNIASIDKDLVASGMAEKINQIKEKIK